MSVDTTPVGPGDTAAVFRAMTRDDIPAGLALCRANGWNQVEGDWALLLDRGGDGCRVATVGGRVVATTTVVDYEQRFAWVGMVLVDAAARGRGIGSTLLRGAIDALGGVPARLDATPKGHPLYLSLGFVEESRLRRMMSAVAGPEAGRRDASVRPMRRGDLEAVVAQDRAVFGAGRAPLLEWALDAAPGLAFVADRGGSPAGYCLGRRGHRFLQAGPVVADDADTAAGLVAACRAHAPDAPMVIDVPAAPAAWAERLARLGFVEERPFIRMCRGTNRHVGRPSSQWAIFGPEWG